MSVSVEGNEEKKPPTEQLKLPVKYLQRHETPFSNLYAKEKCTLSTQAEFRVCSQTYPFK